MSVLQADRIERIAERPAEAHADHPRHDRHNLGRAPHVPRVRQRPHLRPCLHEGGRREQPGNVSELASGGRLCRAPMSENSRPSANSPFSPPHQRQRSSGRPPASASLGQPRPASASLGQSAAWFALAGHTGIVFHVGRAREEVHTAVGHSVQPEQVRRQQVLPLLRERVDSRALQEGGGRTGRQRHLCREQADSDFGTAGAPEAFIRSCFGCPWLQSASADQLVGRHWTAIF